jgi:PAB1-binding protein PBP1
MAYLSDISPYKQDLSELNKSIEEQRQALQSFDFNIENPFEDATVNLQAARLQQEGLAQQQADILAGLRGAGGGAGAAALATGLARQAAKSQAAIAADVSQQEQALQRQQIEAQTRIDQAVQAKEYARMERMLSLTMEEAAAAELKRQQEEAEKAAFGGAIGSIVLGGLGAAIGGPAGAQLGSTLGGALGSSIS